MNSGRVNVVGDDARDLIDLLEVANRTHAAARQRIEERDGGFVGEELLFVCSGEAVTGLAESFC